MQIGSPQVLNYIIDGNGGLYRLIVIPIGVWDMDADMTHLVAHGLAPHSIRSIAVIIEEDADVGLHRTFPLNYMNDANGLVDGKFNVIDPDIRLRRRLGGFFDGVGFDSGAQSRGNMFIWYVD